MGAVKKPTVDNVSAGDKTVSGKLTIGAGQRKARKLDVTIHVTVNRQAGGTEEKTVTISYTNRKADWSVALDSGLVAGDKVTVKQEAGGDISEGVVLEVKKGLNDQHKDELKMPSGEIWIEQTVANIVNAEEQAEALRLVKEANPVIAGDIASVELKINGTSQPKINVTYTDTTTSGEIEAPSLTVKQVTETSRDAKISDITVVGTVIKGKLQGTAPFDGVKVQISTRLSANSIGAFNSGKCTVDKDSSDPVEVSVDSTTGEFTYTIPGNVGLPRAQIVGVSVKEKNKFVSCATSTVTLASPKKTEVRDPKKLTADDKKAIDKAIRDANTINGVSKLPDGTGLDVGGVPAFIEFDEDGNVTIIGPNNIVIDRFDNGSPVFAKNDDGTYKLKDESQVIKYPAKDLVKNIAPKSPEIAVDTDKGEVTITPPAYEKPGEDTDLLSYTVTYKDASGAEKTVTATRDLQTNKWSGSGVNEESGVITLSVENIEVAGTVTATAKDKGGLVPEEKPLESDPATKKLETADVSYDANKGTGKMDAKKLNKGSKYKISDNGFTAPANEKFKTWKIGETEYAAGDEITVKEDTTIQAVWQDIEVTVSYEANGGSGSMDSATMKKGSTYKLADNAFTAPANQKFKCWKIGNDEYAAGAEITVNEDAKVEAVWEDIMVDVNFDAGEGSGSMNKESVKKGSTFKLPPSKFKAPKNMEFKGWKIGDEEKAVGDEITVNDNTTVTAVWKKIPVKVSYDANGGKGSMDGATVDKGSEYTVLPNGFTAPDDTQEFKAWEVNGQEVAPGAKIEADKDTVIKAVWKKIQVDNPNGGSNNNGDGATKASKSPNSGKLSKTGYAGIPYHVAAMILVAGGLLIAGSKKTRKH